MTQALTVLVSVTRKAEVDLVTQTRRQRNLFIVLTLFQK